MWNCTPGSFAYSNKDISIGPQDHELSLTRYYGVHQAGGENPFGPNTGHSYEIILYRLQYIEGPNSIPNYSYEWHVVIGATGRKQGRSWATSRASWHKVLPTPRLV